MSLIQRLQGLRLSGSIRSTIIRHQQFSTASFQQAPKEKDAKANEMAKAKRLTKRKLLAKKDPSTDPLYMTIPQAMRYLRAAELGRSDSESVVTVQTVVFGINGVAPLSGSIKFPHPVKATKIGVVSLNPEIREKALEAGAVMAVDADWVEKLIAGEVNVDLDVLYATEDAEVILKKAARILGPKKLMPSTKKGTITKDVVPLISQAIGSSPFRQKSDFVSLAVGTCSFSDEQIVKNIMAASNAVRNAVTSTVSKKPITLGRTVLSSTHGPGIIINY